MAPGDKGSLSTPMARVQVELYQELYNYLFRWPRDRYLASARLLGIETELRTRLRRNVCVDGRILNAAYYVIANHYLEAHDDGRQTKLPLDGLDNEARLRQQWRAFFRAEVLYLTTKDDFVNAVVTAVTYSEPLGTSAIEWLVAQLRWRYASRACVQCRDPSSAYLRCGEEELFALMWERWL